MGQIIDYRSDQATDESLCGAKAARLAYLHQLGFPVLPHIVVPTTVFAAALQRAMGEDIFQRLNEIAVNRLDLSPYLANVRKRLREQADDQLTTEIVRGLEQAGIEFPVAVRSSAVGEDDPEYSMAGHYESVLEVNEHELGAAVSTCWASLFGERAVLSRRGKRLDLASWRMGVFCQPFVAAVCGGVVFTRSPDGSDACLLIEADPDGPAVVTAGQARWRVQMMRSDCTVAGGDDGEHELFQRVASLALAVEQEYGGPQDIEWVFDGQDVWLIQARPASDWRDVREPTEVPQVVKVVDMDEEPQIDLGPCLMLHRKSLRKKWGLKRVCRDVKLLTSNWFYAVLDRKSLDSGLPDQLEQGLNVPFAYVDVDENVQGINVGRDVLQQFLLTMVDAAAPHPLVVRIRESVPTEMAFISTLMEDGRYYIEYVAGAMKGLASGMAVPSYVVTDRDGTVIKEERRQQQVKFVIDVRSGQLDPVQWGKPQLPSADVVKRICKYDQIVRPRLGNVRPEWWLWQDKLYLEDYSHVGNVPDHVDTAEGKVISLGKAQGRVLWFGEICERSADYLSHGFAVSMAYQEDDVEQIGLVRELRQKVKDFRDKHGDVILVADRPLLIIATLLDLIVGVVCKDAGTLCHLAVILREAGIPAVSAGERIDSLLTGCAVRIGGDGVEVMADE